MVEIVDGVLEFLEHRFLLRPLAGDVGDGPGRDGARPPGADTGRARIWYQRAPPVRSPESGPGIRTSSSVGPPFAHGLRDPVDRLGGLGIAREQPLDRPHLAAAAGSGEREIGRVGVDDPAAPVGDHHAFAERIEIAAGDIEAGLAHADAEQSERQQKQHRHADDGEHGKEAEHQRLHLLAVDQDEADRDADQPEGDDDQAAHTADAVGPVADRLEAHRVVHPPVHPVTFSPAGDTRPRAPLQAARSARQRGRNSAFPAPDLQERGTDPGRPPGTPFGFVTWQAHVRIPPLHSEGFARKLCPPDELPPTNVPIAALLSKVDDRRRRQETPECRTCWSRSSARTVRS